MNEFRLGSQQPCRAVVFDLDGTLVDSYGAIAECFNYARVRLGEAPVAESVVRGLVGHGLESLMEDAVGQARAAEAVRLFRERYDVICEGRTTLLPGVAEVIPSLARAPYCLGVATNKPQRFAVRILDALGVMPHMGAVLGPAKDLPAKPEPDMLLAVCRRLRVEPEQTLYVGDMVIDIDTARRAGVDVWVLPTGSATRSQLAAGSPDRILNDFMDLQELLPAVR